MASENEWARATEKLVEITNSGSLNWQIHPNLREQRDDIQGDPYFALVQTRFIAVYEFRFKFYTDEDSWEFRNEVAVEFIEMGGKLEYRWPSTPKRSRSTQRLFIEMGGKLEYRWPSTPKRWVLLDAIRCVVSRAPQFLKNFLADDHESKKR